MRASKPKLSKQMLPEAPGQLAKAAMRNGYDTIIACGGDGTVHEVLQCLVGTPGRSSGVVPSRHRQCLLAQDLGRGTSPVNAVRKLLAARPAPIPVGRIFFRDPGSGALASLHPVAAGIGADALLMASMDAGLKRRIRLPALRPSRPRASGPPTRSRSFAPRSSFIRRSRGSPRLRRPPCGSRAKLWRGAPHARTRAPRHETAP